MNPYQKYNPLQQKKTKKSLSREPKEQLTEFQKVFLKAEKLYKSAEANPAKVKSEFEHEKASSLTRKDNKELTKIMLEKGTASDKLSTISVLIREQPNFCLTALDQLIEMMKSQNKKIAFSCIEELKSILGPIFHQKIASDIRIFNETINDLVKNAKQEPGSSVSKYSGIQEDQLVDAYFCHHLKIKLEQLMSVLREKMADSLTHFKKIAVTTCCKLLKAFPYFHTSENITNAVNKMGDANEDIVQLVQRLVNFALKNGGLFGKNVLSGIDVMINRPNLAEEIKSKLITSLANINFAEIAERDILVQSCRIFMREFLAICTKDDAFIEKKKEEGKKIYTKQTGVLKGGEEGVKLMNQCLRGLNRVFPNLKNQEDLKEFFENHADKLFRLAHQSSMKVRIQIMILLFQILKADMYSEKAERFFKVVYNMLGDPSFLHSSLTELFLELLFNVIKNDYSIARKCAMVKKLLSNTIHAEPNVIIAVLLFIKMLAKEESGLSQLIENKGNINTFLGDDELIDEPSSDSENEWTEENTKKKATEADVSDKSKNPGDSSKEVKLEVEDVLKLDSIYNPSSAYVFDGKNPLYSNADLATLPELIYLAKHYHPSVQKISKLLMSNLAHPEVKYDGNPLLDFNFTSFLTRFCLKKPKKLNQVQAKKAQQGKLERGRLEDPFSVESVIIQAQEDIRDDEQFIYQFFKKKVEKLDYKNKLDDKKKKKGAKKTTGEDLEEEMDNFTDQLFEDELKKTDHLAGGDLDDEDIEDFEQDGMDEEEQEEDEMEFDEEEGGPVPDFEGEDGEEIGDFNVGDEEEDEDQDLFAVDEFDQDVMNEFEDGDGDFGEEGLQIDPEHKTMMKAAGKLQKRNKGFQKKGNNSNFSKSKKKKRN